MDFFVTTSQAPQTYRTIWSKEEFMEEISKMVDKAIEGGCTFFDMLINTDVDCRVK
jgi:hypothetical protein